MKEHLLSLVENSRGYTLAVVEAMPVKLDDYQPVADVWTFRQQLDHIAYGIEWWKDNFVRGIKTSWEPPANSTTRKEAMHRLLGAYDSLKEALDSLEVDKAQGVFATLDHITHHRAQLVLYLRCNGIAAPEYTY